jgi:glutathione synthase/RimK-type ligase-like ATP-grasp enzyme
MKLFCLDDRGNWGRELAKESSSRGWKSELFSADNNSNVQDGIAFMRLAQEAERLAIEKSLMRSLHDRGILLIPDLKSGLMYEDKYEQSISYNKWMPVTFVITDPQTAEQCINSLMFPFVSKSRTGSSSRNVRLIQNHDEAMREIEAAFGNGLSAPHSLGELVQSNYLIWQEFLQENKYDYRVVATGKKIMVLQRWNRRTSPFASGSGINNPAPWSDEVESVIEFSKRFLEEENILWCGLDVIQNKSTNEWKLLETTLGWSAHAYINCQYYGTPYLGKDMWKVLCNEIEEGVFNK